MPLFKIAGIFLDITSDNEVIYINLRDYNHANNKRPDLSLVIRGMNEVTSSNRNSGYGGVMTWYVSLDKSLTVTLQSDDASQVLARMDIDEKWENASIFYKLGYEYGSYSIIEPLLENLFRNRILFQKGIVIHAAAIEQGARGILFSAPSGTGKTTQANLWKKYLNAVVVNGDHPSIRMINGIPIVFGNPWSGSSNEHLNSYFPIKAIIMVQQSLDNSIIKLSKKEAAIHLLPRCYLPYFSSDLMNKALGTIDEIISTVSVYLLKCRPDKEAVDLVYQYVK